MITTQLLRPLRLVATLTVSLGLASLWLHPGYHRPFAIALVLLLLWPALALPRPVPWPRWRMAWNVVLLVTLAPALATLAMAPERRLDAAVALIAIAELRLAHTPAGSARQERWMVALAAAALTLTAVASVSAWFPVLAGPFLLGAVATLVLSEMALARESLLVADGGLPVARWSPEAAGLWQPGAGHWQHPWRHLALISAGATALTVAAGLALFMAFPRTGSGLSPASTGAGDIQAQFALAGLSNQLTLGSYRVLLEDPAPALEVSWLGPPPAPPVHLRAGALTRLERVANRWVWTNTGESASRELPPDTLTPLAGSEIPPEAVGQRVRVLESGQRVLFALPWLVAVRGPGGVLLHEPGDVWRTRTLAERWPTYEAWSAPVASPWPLSEIEHLRATHLPGALRDAVRAFLLERGVVSPGDPPEQQAQAIIHHLRATHRHSLDLSEIRWDNALEDFLFHPRAGNCEFFASAMVVMCRALNIPARLATGFHGGEVADDGSHLFRRRDAHAWVEAWFPARGWTTLDPTPPDPLVTSTEAGLWPRVSATMSSVARSWRQHIIFYNGAWHRRLLEWSGQRADRVVAYLSGQPGLLARSFAKFQRNVRQEPFLWVFIPAVITLNIFALWLNHRWRRDGPPWRRRASPRQPNEALLAKIARALVDDPRPRRPAETAAEYLARLWPVAEEIQPLIRRYCAWRFGQHAGLTPAQELVDAARRIAGTRE